jgi:transketolase
MLLTRQDVPVLIGTENHALVNRGGYVLADSETCPDVVLIGTGSEVSVALDAAATLTAGGVAVRVVSMPSTDLFEAQPNSYREDVLPTSIPTVSVEAGVTFGWSKWADESVGIDRFGVSAPGEEVMAKLGITSQAVADTARALLGI